MPCEVAWEERGVYQRLSGFVSAREYEQSIRSIQGDARFDDLRQVIVDCLDMTGDDFSEENLAEIAIVGHVAHLSNVNCPVAFVVTTPRLEALIGKLFVDALRDVMDIAILDSPEGAQAWLGALRHSRPRHLFRAVRI
jgi:hypothetical protein